MAKGIEIGIASETKAFKQGIEAGVVTPLEDAEKALDELGKSKGPDQLEDGLKDAQKASEKLEREVKDTADTIEREFRQSYRKLGDEAQKGTRRAADGMDDMKTEAKQSMRETAASIKDVEDGLDLVQEVAANAFAGFGPAGVIAGTAAAVGIGLVSETLRTQQEEADKLKEKMAGMYIAAIEEGRAYIDQETILREMHDIMWNPERVQEFTKAQGDAKALDLDIGVILAANAGELSSIQRVQERIVALRADEVDKLGTVTVLEAAQGQSGSTRLDYLTLALDRYEKMAGAIEEGNAKAQESLRIESEFKAEQSAAHRQNMDAYDERWAKYEETLKKMQEAPQPVITPTLDDSGVRGALDALARRTYRINVEAQVRDRYGRTII